MTDDLAAWLLEQIAEDQRVVEGALKRTRNWKQIDRPWWRLKNGPQRPLRPEEMLLAVWDPDRLLAECDAKRRIVKLHSHTKEIHLAGPLGRLRGL